MRLAGGCLRQGAGRVARDHQSVRNILDDDTTGTYHDIAADTDDLAGTCAYTYPGGAAYLGCASKIGAGADMNTIIKNAVVIYGGPRVNNTGASDPGADIDNRFGENDAASTDHCVPADTGGRMHDASNACTGF